MTTESIRPTADTGFIAPENDDAAPRFPQEAAQNSRTGGNYTIDDHLARLKGVTKSGDGYLALCPAHDDHNPSLSVTPGKNGRPVLFCHAGCSYDAIIAAIGLNRPDARRPDLPTKRQIVAVYDYFDEQGDLLYQKVRYQPKGFAIRRPDGDGWTWKKGDARPVLYRLPELLKAKADGQTIGIVEGEKDADRLHSVGLTATTNIEGASDPGKRPKWRPEYSEQLAGAHRVVILPDNDAPGRAHAAAVAQALTGRVADIRILGLPDLPEKGDVSDWLDAGHTAAELVELASAAPPATPKPKGNGRDTEPPNFEPQPIEAYETDHRVQDVTDNWPRLEADDKPPHIATDQANGYRIAQQAGRDLLYVIRIGWHAWNGTHWRMGEEFAYRKAQRLSRLILADAARATQKAADTEDGDKRKELMQIGEALTGWAAKSESRDRVYAAMAMARPILAIEHGELDNNHWLLNCVNGTLDLRTGALRPHRRSDFITRCIPIAYDPEATCPTWLKFLERIFANVTEVIRFTQKAIGYSLTGDISEQCVFFCWGSGQNGKSTLLTLIQALMGAYAQQAAPNLLVASKHEHHTTEIAELRGARLVASIETGEGRRLNEPLLKQMSGGDRMKGRFMRQDNIEFTPTHKTWLATNHKPKIRGTDYAIWRRIRLIPFVVTIPPEERDQALPEKLKAELPGILAWAVQGCLAWQQDGLEPPKAVVEATDQYRADSDVLAAFLLDRCVIDRNARVKAAELYNAYRQWCEQNGERLTETQMSFGLRMTERGVDKRRLATGWHYEGIALQAVGYEEGEL